MTRRRARGAALVAAAALLASPAAAAAQGSGAAAPKRVVRTPTTYEDLQMFSQVLNNMRVNHPDSLDLHALFMAAVEGMVQAADPHSYVLPATRLSPETEAAFREGRITGMPLSFRFLDDAPTLVAVAPGSAAARLDLLPGDELTAIDGQPVRAESEEELAITLAGPKGTSAKLAFRRRRLDGSIATFTHEVKRERAGETTAVPAALMLDKSTGYLRITTFANERVQEDMRKALGDLERQGMQRLVLDLRDNGGGYVKEAAQAVGEFLPRGAIVYTSETRKTAADTGRVERSFFRGEKRYPLIVMVNRGTASASELVAGALQDHDRALIVGEASFGKALMMIGMPLTDGSVVMLTVGHIRTPCGRVVQRQYRNLSRRDYYRLAGEARDTTGRPSCRTDGGRTVYGGGGIIPDRPLAARTTPPWVSALRERGLVFQWATRWLATNGAQLPAAEAIAANPVLPAGALADFRAMAAAEKATIPDDPDVEPRLTRMLLGELVLRKYGESGYFRMAALVDPQVQEAVGMFGEAEQVLRVSTLR